MTETQVLSYALRGGSLPRDAERVVEYSPLTRREWQIAEAVAEGLKNRDIAGRFVIAQRTAEGHVEHILRKLGFTSRAQIAAWVAERSRPGVAPVKTR